MYLIIRFHFNLSILADSHAFLLLFLPLPSLPASCHHSLLLAIPPSPLPSLPLPCHHSLPPAITPSSCHHSLPPAMMACLLSHGSSDERNENDKPSPLHVKQINWGRFSRWKNDPILPTHSRAPSVALWVLMLFPRDGDPEKSTNFLSFSTLFCCTLCFYNIEYHKAVHWIQQLRVQLDSYSSGFILRNN